MKKILLLLFIISVLFGCSNEKGNNEFKIIMTLFPVGSYKDVYMFELIDTTVLEVSLGVRRNENLKSKRYMLEEGLIESQKITLSEPQFDEITRLAKEAYAKDEVSVNNNRDGGRQIIIMINDKQYSFYEGEYENDSLGKLVKELVENSPVPVEPGENFY